jgi:hypothetical protein
MKVKFSLIGSKVFDVNLSDYPGMTEVEAIESIKDAFLDDPDLFISSRDIHLTMEAKVTK